MAGVKGYCTWTQEELGGDWWNTGCEQEFMINSGKPSDNDMAYCCYCGNPLREVTALEAIYAEDDVRV